MPRPLKSETWRQIFRYFVEPDSHQLEDNDESLPTSWPHGSRAQIVSSVCAIWRKVAMRDRFIWSSIYISSRQPLAMNIRRAGHYIQRSGGKISNICILVEKEFSKDQLKLFSEAFYDLTQLEIIDCMLSPWPAAKEGMTKLLTYMPPASTVILRGMVSSSSKMEVRYEIPGRIVAKAERLVAHRCTFSWKASVGHTFTVRELEILSLFPYPTARPQESPFAVNEWGTGLLMSLERCTIDETYTLTTKPKSRLELPSLSSLTSLEIPLGLLLQVFYKSVRLPALTSITIRSVVNATLDDWKHFISIEEGGSRIKEITIRSMDRADAISLVPYIDTLSSLITLGLEGESVSGVVKRLYAASDAYHDMPNVIPPPNPSLSVLKVRSYDGEGRTLAKFVHLRSWLADSEPHRGPAENPIIRPLRVQLLDCEGLTQKAKDIVSPYRF
ncbi:hypothetical protein FS842_010275 [Serendipita sp. 407]|nr:hypothetical protein FS842_010275 [Serendipita sp. 407]